MSGHQTPDTLMADIKAGLYVTELIGMGVNGVTGDYSRGAAGFWIENGQPAYPVSEITIAGNLKDMFARLTPAKISNSATAPTPRPCASMAWPSPEGKDDCPLFSRRRQHR
jgi:PmbA protein